MPNLPEYTRRQQAMKRLMDKSGIKTFPFTPLERQRFDDEESFLTFVNSHEFVTDIISYGNGQYEVEYFA
jgi:hypothetical protein